MTVRIASIASIVVLATSVAATASAGGPALRLRGAGRAGDVSRAGVEERDARESGGVEQSFIVSARPTGSGPLEVVLDVVGARAALLRGHTDGAALRDASGRVRATYRDLKAFDATGRELPSHMEAAGSVIDLVVDDATAVYPVLVDPLMTTEQAELTPTDGVKAFGEVVAISGDTAVVGAPYAANSWGAAYVFTRSGSTWAQTQRLEPTDPGSGRRFGSAVAVQNGTILVGTCNTNVPGTGAFYAFSEQGGTWSQTQEITRPTPGFGCTLALDGDSAVVGRTACQGALTLAALRAG